MRVRGFLSGILAGKPCGSFGKSRVVILGRCNGIEDFEKINQTTGVQGCIVGEFNEGVYALVFKERNREFKACKEIFSLCNARV